MGKKKRYRRKKIKLEHIARESIALADKNASFSVLHEIFEKKWLSGAEKLGCTIIKYCDNSFIHEKSEYNEIPAFLRRQILNAFGKFSDYRAGHTFTYNNEHITLIEMEIKRKKGKTNEQIAAAFFIPAIELQ